MKNTIYKYAPVFLQNVGISIYGLYWKNRRFGGIFKKELEGFRMRESYDSEQWMNYQTSELRKLLVHSFQTVPYYRDKYSGLGFKLKDFQRFELSELKNLPILEKDDLRKFGRNDLLSSIKDKGDFFASSGSTGTPTSIYFSKKTHQKWSAAYESRVRNWAQVNMKMPRGMIGGRRVLPGSADRKPYYRYNYFEKQTYFSAYHISESTVANYLKGLVENKVVYLVGYAMSIYFLADFLLKSNLKIPQLKAVLTSSEKLTPKMRTTIEQAFHCKVFDGYSGVEACGLISENIFGELLFSPDTGILEVLDENGRDVEYGGSGNVISTGFLNYDQPLIRYNIGDRVELSKNQETESGLNMLKIKGIEGRTEDVIVGVDGRKMVRFHSLFVEIPSIKQAQVIQHSYELIEIKLVTTDDFSGSDENKIRERLISQIGELEVSFSYESNIPIGRNGKYKAVISNL